MKKSTHHNLSYIYTGKINYNLLSKSLKLYYLLFITRSTNVYDNKTGEHKKKERMKKVFFIFIGIVDNRHTALKH